MDGYEQQAKLMKALSHPTRLRILDILSGGEACVCHLTAILGQRQPYVSQHLMTLREANLVSDRRDGVIVYYRLAERTISEILKQTRELVADGFTFPQNPELPVDRCPCPKCEEAASSSR